MSCKIEMSSESLQTSAMRVLGSISKYQSSTKTYDTIKQKKFIDTAFKENIDMFKKHGLYFGDKHAMNMTTGLYEKLLTPEKLINGLKKVGIIGKNKFNGDYWLRKTNDQFTSNMSYAKHQALSEKLLRDNIEAMEYLNGGFRDITGMDVVLMTKTANGVIVRFNEEALPAYNASVYSDYVNELNTYLAEPLSRDYFIEEDPIKALLDTDLKKAKKQRIHLEHIGATAEEKAKNNDRLQKLAKRIATMKQSKDVADYEAEASRNLTEIEKLLDSANISIDEILKAERKLDTWRSIGDFSSLQDHILFKFQPHLFKSKIIQEKFREIKSDAEALNERLQKVKESMLISVVNKTQNAKIDRKELLTLSERIRTWGKNVLGLNTIGNAIIDSIYKRVNKINDLAFLRVKKRSKDLAEIHSKMKKSKFDERKYLQKDEGGILTGNLIDRYSSKFLNMSYRREKDLRFRKSHMIDVDVNLIAGGDKDKIDAYTKNILIPHLGEIGAKEIVKQAAIKWNEFLDLSASYIQAEFNAKEVKELSKEQLKDYNEWMKEFSPFHRSLAIKKAKYNTDMDEVPGRDTYVVSFPRKTFKNGKKTGYYDSNFSEVESNSAAYDFYLEAKKIITRSSEIFGEGSFTANSLASIQSTLFSDLLRSGTSSLTKGKLRNRLVNSLSSNLGKENKVDSVTGEPIYGVNKGVTALDNEIKKKYYELEQIERLKFIQSIRNNPNSVFPANYNPTEVEVEAKADAMIDKKAVLRQASDETFNAIGGTIDLFENLNMIDLAAESYGMKMDLEPELNLLKSYVKNIKGPNSDVRDASHNSIGESTLRNMMEMLENHLRVKYYGYTSPDESLHISKVYKKDEKKSIVTLDAIINDESLPLSLRETASDTKERLGNTTTFNVIMDKVLDIFRINSLGWNLSAGLVNLTYGMISNFVHSTGNTEFSMSGYLKAVKDYSTNFKKANNIIKNYNIIGDIAYEFEQTNKFEEKQNWFSKTIKTIKPYTLQTSAEHVNQGTVVVAMLQEQMVTDSKGNEISFWDAMDEEGSLSDEYSYNGFKGDEAAIEFNAVVRTTIEQIHGDYNNPLISKAKLGGKVLFMFKTWIGTFIENRFGEVKYSHTLKRQRGGYYRTSFNLALNFKDAHKRYKEGKLTDIEISNLRKLTADLSIMVLMAAAGAALKALACDEDDCSEAHWTAKLALNIGNRVGQDMSQAITISGIINLIKNPVAASRMLSDLGKAFTLTTYMISGEEDKLIYQSGFNKGRNKFGVLVESYVPLWTQIKRTMRSANEVSDY